MFRANFEADACDFVRASSLISEIVIDLSFASIVVSSEGVHS